MIVPKPTPIPGHEDSTAEASQKRRGVNGAAVETVVRKTRRTFSASEKLRIVQAAEAAVTSGERGALVALLRKEGIYSSHLATWRSQLRAHGTEGLVAQKPGRKPKHDATERELLAAQKKIAALEKKLLVANAIVELQKKAHELMGIALPDTTDLEETS